MPTYKVGFPSVAAAGPGPYFTFNSLTRKAQIHEVDIFLATAVQSQWGFGTPANEATPPVATTTIIPPGKPSDIAATARVGTAWSTAPTAPTVFEHVGIFPNVIGSGVVLQWTPDAYTEVKIAGWRTLWNSAGSAGGQLLVSLIYDE